MIKLPEVYISNIRTKNLRLFDIIVKQYFKKNGFDEVP